MTAVDRERVDVAIVGLGPVGAVLAILLGQMGRRVAVVERWPQPYGLPRAVHFDHEVARILQGCGLGAQLGAISEPADVYEWRNAQGETLLRFLSDGHGRSGWPKSSMFNQPALESMLEGRAGQLDSVEIRRGIEITALDQTCDGATLSGADESGAEVDIDAAFVVGCDGAGSTIRDLLGIPMHDRGYFHDWLVVDVVPNEARAFDPMNVQICDPARPTTAVSGGPGRRRWEFMRLPHERLEDLEDERTTWALLEPWGIAPDNATIERRAVYTFQARWAERWRERRVLLTGDAAHQMPPFAGQGMCAGIRDAANLAWKLDLVLDGHADTTLLDTYQVERLPHVQTAIDFSMELGKVICIPDPGEAAARDAAMIGTAASVVPDIGGLHTGLIHATAPHAGALFPQGRTKDAAGCPARFDDVVAPGWLLVTPHERLVLDDDLLGWFGTIGGRVVTIDAGDLVDLDGTYRDWFAAHDALAALQRPDFHVYGTAGDHDGATELLSSLRSALHAAGRDDA